MRTGSVPQTDAPGRGRGLGSGRTPSRCITKRIVEESRSGPSQMYARRKRREPVTRGGAGARGRDARSPRRRRTHTRSRGTAPRAHEVRESVWGRSTRLPPRSVTRTPGTKFQGGEGVAGIGGRRKPRVVNPSSQTGGGGLTASRRFSMPGAAGLVWRGLRSPPPSPTAAVGCRTASSVGEHRSPRHSVIQYPRRARRVPFLRRFGRLARRRGRPSPAGRPPAWQA